MPTTVNPGSLPPGTMRHGARVQIRVIGALILREMHTRYGRENIGYVWLFLEPMLLATMIAILHSRAPSHFGSDLKPVPLSLIGYCNFMTFRSIFNRAEGALDANLPLLHHRTVSIVDVLVSRAILDSAGTWIAFAVLISLCVATGMANPPERPLVLILGMVLMVWLSLGLAMVVCAITHDRHAIGRLIHPLSYIMMPLSGAFFTMKSLPESIRNIFLYIPLAHVFEILRYGWFKTATPEFIDPMYLAAWILISTLLGLLLLALVRQRIHMP